jgi:hypothetical protein
MDNAKKAIETTGTIDLHKRLVLDKPLPVTGPVRVRVLILLPDEDDINETEWYQAAANNPAFDFLKETEEDLYTLDDGRPFHDHE